MNTHLPLSYYYSCCQNQIYSAPAEVLKKNQLKKHPSFSFGSEPHFDTSDTRTIGPESNWGKKQNSIFKAQAVSLQSEIFKYDSFSDFARGLTVDFALLDPEMLTQEEAIML